MKVAANSSGGDCFTASMQTPIDRMICPDANSPDSAAAAEQAVCQMSPGHSTNPLHSSEGLSSAPHAHSSKLDHQTDHADTGTPSSPLGSMSAAKPSAEEAAGCLSKLLFWWATDFLESSYQIVGGGRNLQMADLHAVPTRERLGANTNRMFSLWAEQMQSDEPSLLAAIWQFMKGELIPSFLLTGVFVGCPLHICISTCLPGCLFACMSACSSEFAHFRCFVSTPVMMGRVIDALLGCTSSLAAALAG